MTVPGGSPLNYPPGSQPPVKRVVLSRAPTSNDTKNFREGDEWLDKSSDDWYKLAALSGQTATWVKIGGTGGPLEGFTVSTGTSPVVPSASNYITLTDGNGTAWTGGTNELTLDMSSPFTGDFTFNGSLQVDNLNFDGNAFTSTTGIIDITPLAGENLEITLSTTGDLIVNTDQFVIDTSAGQIGIGTAAPAATLDLQVADPTDAFGINTWITKYTESDTDTYNQGIVGGAPRLYVTNLGGTKQQAIGYSDTTSTSATIFGVSGSIDSGSTWVPGILVGIDGHVDLTNNLITLNTDGDIIPAGAAQDVGSSGSPWANMYVDDLIVTNTITADTFETSNTTTGLTITDNTITADGSNTDIDLQINGQNDGGIYSDKIKVNDTASTSAVTIDGVSVNADVIAGDSAGTAVLQYLATSVSDTASLGGRIVGSRSRTTGSVVQDDDVLLQIYSTGNDGTDFATAANISFEVDGTPGTNDMPGRIVFNTSPDGSQTPAEGLRISQDKTVTFASAFTFPITDGSANQVLTTDGAGTVTWEDQDESIWAYTDVNSSPYTVLSTDYYLSVDTSSSAITVELPNAPTTAKVYYIKDRSGNSGAKNITVTTAGGVVTIDGSTSYVMSSNYSAISVIFNGTSYEVF